MMPAGLQPESSLRPLEMAGGGDISSGSLFTIYGAGAFNAQPGDTRLQTQVLRPGGRFLTERIRFIGYTANYPVMSNIIVKNGQDVQYII